MNLETSGPATPGSLEPTMSAVVAPQGIAGDLRVQPRELKLVCERLMMVLGVPAGAWTPARDALLASVASGLPVLPRLADLVAARSHDSAGALSTAWRSPTVVTEESGEIVVEAHGVSALLVGHVLANLAAAHPDARIVVRSLLDADLVTGLTPLLARLGRELHVQPASPGSDGVTVLTTGALEGRANDLLGRLADGVDVSAQLWWNLYYPSNLALSLDTPVSRRHTGASLLVPAAGPGGGTILVDAETLQESGPAGDHLVGAR